MLCTPSTYRKSQVGANCHTITSLLFLQSDTINVFKCFKCFIIFWIPLSLFCNLAAKESMCNEIGA